MIVPFLWIAAFIYLYHALGAPPFLGSFVVVGGTMIAFWSNVLWSMSAQFYWEKEAGNLEVYLVAPTSRMAVLLGMALGGIINTSLRALVIFGAGYLLFDIPLQLVDPGALLAVFTLTFISLYALGMLFSSLFMLYGREAWHTATLLEEPVYFLSGFFFPVLRNPLVPWFLQLLASLIPVTFGLDGIRILLIMGGGLGDVQLHILVLALFSLVLIPLARRALRFMEDLGRREGRLTLRWQ
jgi:ABC-2 type transport system permease protein